MQTVLNIGITLLLFLMAPSLRADEVARQLRLAIEQLEAKGNAELAREGGAMHARLDAARSPLERLLAALRLGEFYSSQNERLSLQYLALAEAQIPQVRPSPERKSAGETIAFLKARTQFRVRSFDATLQSLQPLIGKIKRPELEKEAWEMVIACHAQMHHPGEVVRHYESYAKKYEFFSQNDDVVAEAAKAYQQLQQNKKSVRLMELLAERYPHSAASRWAFTSLQEMSESSTDRYYFGLGLLTRIARNVNGDNEVRDALLAQLKKPLRTNQRAPRLLTGTDLVQAYLKLRAYPEAFTLATQLLEQGQPSTMVRATLNRWMGLALAAQGQLESAVTHYAAYFKGVGLPIQASVTPSLSNGMNRIASYRLAAKEFDDLSLAGDQSIPWQQFWQSNFARARRPALAMLRIPDNIAARDPLEPRATEYWQAKAMLRDGNKREAMKLLTQIVRKEPESYYSALIVSAYPSFKKMVAFNVGQSDRSRVNLTPAEGATPIVSLTDGLMQAYGMNQSSGAALPVNSLLMASNKTALPVASDTSPRQERLRVAYPQAYQDIVEKTTGIVRLDKYLLWSIMKAESRYNPKARSPAGARGLVQIMPRTAKHLANQLEHEGFEEDRLEAPAVNVAYGAYYLRNLMERYRDNYFLVIAAYNAGPGAVDGWVKNCGNCGLDEFVDSIPYRETRQYVKKVIRFYAGYRAAYEGEWGLPPLPVLPLRMESSPDLAH